MQMTTDARAWLDAAVRRILARHPLGDAERAGITYELMSHLHAAGEARAAAAGRGEVTRRDLEAALAEAGGEERLAEAFVQPLARPVERASAGRRLGAFAIDVLLLLLAIGSVHGAAPFMLKPIAGDAPAPAYDASLWGLMPWGFHDPALPVLTQAAIAVLSAAVVLGYFTWLEARDGRTLGKRALGLRVMRADGRPVTARDALARSVAKLSPPLLLVDALVLLFAEGRRRASDRIAGTVVVRA